MTIDDGHRAAAVSFSALWRAKARQSAHKLLKFVRSKHFLAKKCSCTFWSKSALRAQIDQKSDQLFDPLFDQK